MSKCIIKSLPKQYRLIEQIQIYVWDLLHDRNDVSNQWGSKELQLELIISFP